MNGMDSTIIAGFVSALGVVISAWLALRGRREETAQTHAAALIDSQGQRIAAMEARQDKMQADIDDLRFELHHARRAVEELGRALEEALSLLRKVRRWVDDGAVLPAPRFDLEWLEEVLAERARPRRPPDRD